MSSDPKSNPAASIRARLLRIAQNSGEDYQRVLGRYGIERFLYRLGESSYRDRFALKGATLFTLWTGQAHRPTKDLDLLGWGSSAIEDVESTIRTICGMNEEDGIVFDTSSVEGIAIKEDDEYNGVRIKFNGQLSGARIPMQIDIGFGDAVYPDPELADFPVLLPMAAPRIRVYPRESAIAEKLHAMVELDIRNTRMKDFYDIWFMATMWEFELTTLDKAIAASFHSRGIAVPRKLPFALTEDFTNSAQKRQQWGAFIRRLNPPPLLVEFVTSGAVTREPTLEIGAGTGTNAIGWRTAISTCSESMSRRWPSKERTPRWRARSALPACCMGLSRRACAGRPVCFKRLIRCGCGCAFSSSSGCERAAAHDRLSQGICPQNPAQVTRPYATRTTARYEAGMQSGRCVTAASHNDEDATLDRIAIPPGKNQQLIRNSA